MQISGQTILISGGSSGLGAGCRDSLLAAGANVGVIDRKPTESSLETDGRFGFEAADVTSESAVQQAVANLKERFGELRGAVLCAGILDAQRLLPRHGTGSLEAFRRVIEVNLIGTFHLLRMAAEAMQDNSPDQDGQRGVIVMTSSISAFEGQIGQVAYAASKGAVASMTLPAARELSRVGIRVVTIAPGVFETAMMENVSPAYRQSLIDQTVFPRRFGQPAEFAALVMQILSNPMINGTIIRLDGGMRMPGR